MFTNAIPTQFPESHRLGKPQPSLDQQWVAFQSRFDIRLQYLVLYYDLGPQKYAAEWPKASKRSQEAIILHTCGVQVKQSIL